MYDGRSLIKIKNSVGPNTVSCRIAEIRSAEEEAQPSSTTLCFLPDKNAPIQLHAQLRIP